MISEIVTLSILKSQVDFLIIAFLQPRAAATTLFIAVNSDFGKPMIRAFKMNMTAHLEIGKAMCQFDIRA